MKKAFFTALIAAGLAAGSANAQLVNQEDFAGLTVTTCPGQTIGGSMDGTFSTITWGAFEGASGSTLCDDTLGLTKETSGFGGATSALTWSDQHSMNIGNNQAMGTLFTGLTDYWYAMAFKFNGTPTVAGTYFQIPNPSDSTFNPLWNLVWFGGGGVGGLQPAGSASARNNIAATPAFAQPFDNFIGGATWHLLIVRQRLSTTGNTALFEVWVDPANSGSSPVISRTAFNNTRAAIADNVNYAVATFLPSANADHGCTMTVSKVTYWNAAGTTLGDVIAAYAGTASVSDWSLY